MFSIWNACIKRNGKGFYYIGDILYTTSFYQGSAKFRIEKLGFTYWSLFTECDDVSAHLLKIKLIFNLTSKVRQDTFNVALTKPEILKYIDLMIDYYINRMTKKHFI